MTVLRPLKGVAPKWQLAYFGSKAGYFGRMMGKPILKSIGLNLAVLSHKNLQKTTKMAISQNPIFPKCPSPKSLLLLHFSTNPSEILKINVDLHSANNVLVGFLI